MKEYDAILVGAGPCGLAAAADFQQAGVEYVHLEQGQLAQSIQRFPKGITLFSPRRLLGLGGIPLPGNQDEPPQVEEYLRYLRAVTESLRLCVKTHQRIHSVKHTDAGYLLSVSSTNGWSEDYLSHNLVVATGGYCSPERGRLGEWAAAPSFGEHARLPPVSRHWELTERPRPGLTPWCPEPHRPARVKRPAA